MSVLACDRRGCEKVMCDHISHKHNAYLCWECMEELANNPNINLDSEEDIENFLRSEKKANYFNAHDRMLKVKEIFSKPTW